MFLEETNNLLDNKFLTSQIPLKESYIPDLIPMFENMSKVKFDFNKIESKYPNINTYKEYTQLKQAYNRGISLAISMAKPKYDNLDALLWAISDLLQFVIKIFVFTLIAPLILTFIILLGLIVLVSLLVAFFCMLIGIIFGENKKSVTTKDKKRVNEIKGQLNKFKETLKSYKSNNKNNEEVRQINIALDLITGWCIPKLSKAV